MRRVSKRAMENEQINPEMKKIKEENQHSVQLDEIIHNPGLQKIAVEIFQFLDPVSLGKCRLVSKDWRAFIDNDRIWWQELLKSTKIWEKCWSYPGRDFQGSEWNTFLSEFSKCLDYVCANETSDNIIKLGLFMKDYLSSQKQCNFEGYKKKWETPIHFAALTNRLDVFELLGNVPTFHGLFLNLLIDQIKRYPRPRKPSLYDQEVEEKKREQFEIIEAFMKTPTIDFTGFIHEGGLRYNAFTAACRKKAPEIVEALLKTSLERGFRMNQTDQDGMTAVHYACMATDWRLVPSETQ